MATPVNAVGQPYIPLIGPIPEGLCPQALPCWIVAGCASVGGKRMVVIQATTPSGPQFYFLPPDAARAVGEGIMKAAVNAESGIILP